MPRTDWKESKYTDLIRITKASKEWLVKYKGKKSAAGFLEEIINQYKHGPKQKGGATPQPKRDTKTINEII